MCKKQIGDVLARVVILGAGLTGLSTAYHLEKKGFFDYKLFEKENEVGGLCRSVHQDGFTFDFTGHLLHINNPYFLDFVKNVVGLEHFNCVTRNSFIFSHGVHTCYPFQINLYGLPEQVITDCIEGFVEKKKTKNPHNYYQWVLKHFGVGFGKHFFFPYQQKIFAYDPRKLAHSWTGRFVPTTTLAQIIRGATADFRDETVGYNATFYYPARGGISLLVEKIAQTLLLPIQTNFCATKIDLQNKRIHFSNGHVEPYEQLINTIPLDLLLKNIKDRPATNFYPAHKKLLCNSVVNFNLGFAGQATNKSWIYYPEKKFPFYRIGFPHTFSKNMTPPNCSSLYGEIAYLKSSKAILEKKLHDALHKTKKLFNLPKHQLKTEQILQIKHAYVIYNQWREKHLEQLLLDLQKENIYSIGRYGAWKYSSMQEAVLDGKEVVEKIAKPFFIKTSDKQKRNQRENVL